MRTLATSRRVGRLMSSPEPTKPVARRLARQWWYGGAEVNGDDVVVSPPIPAGTRWCSVRLLGAGGIATFDPGDSNIGYMGAGGCYARRLLPLRPGQAPVLTVGGQRYNSSPDPPRASWLTVDGVIVCRAAGGPDAAVGLNAPAASASDCIGDVIRVGGPGGAVAYQGGEAAGDLQDPDSLGLGGVSRRGRHLDRPAAFATQLVAADYGAGGVAGASGDPGFLWWPPSPSGGSYQVGGPGMAVLEFYDRRPY